MAYTKRICSIALVFQLNKQVSLTLLALVSAKKERFKQKKQLQKIRYQTLKIETETKNERITGNSLEY